MVANGVTKATYGHTNAEPDFLGLDVAAMVKAMLANGQEASVKAQVVALTSVPSNRQITPAELTAFQVNHPEITTIQQFYDKLDALLGDIPGTLAWGVYKDYAAFTPDPGYTQVDWGYLVDFDTRVFEVYRGQQFGPPTLGRLVGLSRASTQGMKSYYPLQRVGSFTFAQVSAATLPARWWVT